MEWIVGRIRRQAASGNIRLMRFAYQAYNC